MNYTAVTLLAGRSKHPASQNQPKSVPAQPGKRNRFDGLQAV